MTDKKSEVTDELLTDLAKNEAIINPDWLVENAKQDRRNARYTALNHAVQLETARNLTENPEDVTKRILTRCEEFYKYIQTDEEIAG